MTEPRHRVPMRDPYREMRREQAERDRRLRNVENVVKGNTRLGGEPWKEEANATITVTGNEETPIKTAKLSLAIITPKDRRLSFRLSGIFYIAANGASTSILSFSLRQDGAIIGYQILGDSLYPVSGSRDFLVEDLMPGVHIYEPGWYGSDPLNTRHLDVGPFRPVEFAAFTSPTGTSP